MIMDGHTKRGSFQPIKAMHILTVEKVSLSNFDCMNLLVLRLYW